MTMILFALVSVVLPPTPDGERIDTGAVATAQAERLTPPTPVEYVETGLWGMPFAPEGMSDCDEFRFYRQQWGLPAQFDALGWRESNCRNEEGVHTSCCWGYLQLNVALHLSDHRLVGPYHQCGVFSRFDVDSDDPLDKQRQLCAAGALFKVVGSSAWSL